MLVNVGRHAAGAPPRFLPAPLAFHLLPSSSRESRAIETHQPARAGAWRVRLGVLVMDEAGAQGSRGGGGLAGSSISGMRILGLRARGRSFHEAGGKKREKKAFQEPGPFPALSARIRREPELGASWTGLGLIDTFTTHSASRVRRLQPNASPPRSSQLTTHSLQRSELGSLPTLPRLYTRHFHSASLYKTLAGQERTPRRPKKPDQDARQTTSLHYVQNYQAFTLTDSKFQSQLFNTSFLPFRQIS